MHPDIEALRPKIKEILYDCAVEVRATKAAVYFWDGGQRFNLAADYGFKVPIREWADLNDPIVDRCGRGRAAFIINSLAEEARFSEILYETHTERMLVMPMWLRGQLVGLIDMRDKAGKQPFEQSDMPKAQQIAERLLALFAAKNVFGQRYITIASDDEGAAPPASSTAAKPEPSPAVPPAAARREPVQAAPVATPSAAPLPVAPSRPSPAPPPPVAAPPLAPPPRPAGPPQGEAGPRASSVVFEAHSVVDDLLSSEGDDVLTDAELVVIRDNLKVTLSIPGAIVALFTAYRHMGGVQEVVGRARITDDAITFLHSRLQNWLSKRGENGGALQTVHLPPVGAPAAPIDASQLQKVFTAPVNAGTLAGMYLTVGFSGTPDRNAHELLAENLTLMQTSIETSMNGRALQTMRVRAAYKLLEPDFAKFPALRAHTDEVVFLVDRFTRDLALPPAESEKAIVLAIVHDSGMRLLEYARLYRKRDISPDEIAILREHVFVGAALVGPIFGSDLARAVLAHHERVDGKGYPHELRGDQIPAAARIVQICDAYVAMTDPDGYQPPESKQDALGIIERAAGTQFDRDLAMRFVQMMRR